MVDWLHSLSMVSLVLVVCAATAIVTLAIFVTVTRLAAAGQSDALAAVSPGLLPPMALVFGLLVGFLAAEVWSNNSSAEEAVDQEASALRSVDLLDGDFPAADQRRMDLLIREYIEQVVDTSGRRWLTRMRRCWWLRRSSPPPSSWHWRYPLTTRAEQLRSARS